MPMKNEYIKYFLYMDTNIYNNGLLRTAYLQRKDMQPHVMCFEYEQLHVLVGNDFWRNIEHNDT